MKIVNFLSEIIKDHETRFGANWKPSKRFYQATGIKQRRFGQLLRDEVSPTMEEVGALSEFFGVEPKEIYQLESS